MCHAAPWLAPCRTLPDVNATALWTWGDERLWCDETLNQLLGVSPDHVAAQGHASVMVWSRASGDVVSRARGFAPWRRASLDDDGTLHLAGPAGARCLRPGADALDDAPDDDRPLPRWEPNRDGGTGVLRWPDGASLDVVHPGQLIKRVSFARDGRRAAVVSVFFTAVYEAGRAGPLRVFEGCGEAALSADGRELALCDWRGSRVFFGDVDTGALRGRDGLVGAIQRLGVSPDGARLALATSSELRVLDTATRARCFAVAGAVDRFAWSRDGRRMVSFEDGALVRRDAATGEVRMRRALFPDVRRVSAAAFLADADARRVALTVVRYPGGLMFVPPEEALVLDADDGATVATVPLADATATTALDVEPWDASVLALSDDGARLALSGAAVRVYDLASSAREPVARIPMDRWTGFRAEGLALAEDGDALEVRRVEGGAVTARRRFEGARGATITPDGRRAAIAQHDGVTVLDDALRVRAKVPARRPPTALALSPDGATLIVAENAPSLAAWRVG